MIVLLTGLFLTFAPVALPDKAIIVQETVCISPSAEAKLADDHNYTKRIVLEGLEVSRWFDAYAKVARVAREDVLKADKLVFNYNPDDLSVVVVSIFLDDCLVSRVPMPAEGIEQVNKAYQELKAQNG